MPPGQLLPLTSRLFLPLPALPPCRWVEQDPLAIWASVQEAVQSAMQSAAERHGPLNVRAVGITNQREWAADRPLLTPLLLCGR